MEDNSAKPTSRRSALKQAALLAGVAMVPLWGPGAKAIAAGKLTKDSVKYQNTGKNGKDCDDCMQFVPGKAADNVGTCKIVEGVISPHGYCLAFTAKPKRV